MVRISWRDDLHRGQKIEVFYTQDGYLNISLARTPEIDYAPEVAMLRRVAEALENDADNEGWTS